MVSDACAKLRFQLLRVSHSTCRTLVKRASSRTTSLWALRGSNEGNHHCTSWATVLCFLHADDAFVGCLTLAPTNAEAAERDGRAWIGSPPLKLLQRQQSKTFSLCRTFEPTVWMWMQRGTIEFIGGSFFYPSTFLKAFSG